MFHQGRAIKGTVLLNRKLPSNTIQVRPSTRKIAADDDLAGEPALNKFEIVGTRLIIQLLDLKYLSDCRVVLILYLCYILRITL
ncbi:hypothetical protein vseg_000557 [Gypsophila vaccaria]